MPDGDPAALRGLPLERVLEAQGNIGREGAAGEVGLPWQPVLGSEVVPRLPLDAVRDGAADGIDVVVGTTLEEMRLFPLLSPSLADVDDDAVALRTGAYEALQGRESGSMLAAYEERTASMSAPDRWLAILTDLVFRVPAVRLAEAVGDRGGQAHMYLFAERSDAFGGLLGACHALDLPYTWDALGVVGTDLLVGEVTEARRDLARRMADAWVAFASGEDDPGPGLTWPPYERTRRATLWLSAGGIEVRDDPFSAERRWWDGLDGGLGFDRSTVA